MAAYSLALRDLDLAHLKAVVDDIVTGRALAEERFCPRPPELARLVRNRQELEARLATPVRPSWPRRSTIAPFEVAIEKARTRFAGRPVLAEFSGHMDAMALVKSRSWPDGTVFSYTLGKVFGPESGTQIGGQ